MRKITLMLVFLISLMSLSMSAFAAPAMPVTVERVEVEGVELDPSGSTPIREVLDRGDELDVRVRLIGNQTVEDATLRVFIDGYKYETISDSVWIHEIEADRAYTEDFSIRLPSDLKDGEYILQVMLSNADRESLIEEYDIEIARAEDLLAIDDVVFYDDLFAQPGEALYSIVRVENMGDDDQESVKVTMSVPALGIKTSDYMDKIEAEDSETSTELYVRVPMNARAGQYDVEIEVEYDKGYESVSEFYTLTVVEAESKPVVEEPKTLVSAAIEPQTIKVGSTGVYPITISNLGNSAKTYTITIQSAADWGTFKVSPSNLLLLESKEAKTAYLYVTPNANADETNLFVVEINDGTESKQVALQADVSAQETGGFRRALEIGLIVLVVLLVIVGLIVAFTKLASNDDDDDEDDDETTQTYY
jgi:uncharacterized membrane protein